ncbi:MAG: toprim domain-containing protein [Patescibacteria group bacterium]
MLPKPLHDAAAAFDSIPGIGPRAALRYATWLVAQPKEAVKRFARSLDALADGITICPMCGMWTDQPICDICTDPRRDETKLCVVATSQDVRVIEDSGAFRGRYAVLGGVIDPIEGKTHETLAIDTLIRRLTTPDSRFTEVILAFDPDVAGDTTAMVLTKKIQEIAMPDPSTIRQAHRGESDRTTSSGSRAESRDDRHPRSVQITRLARGIQHGAQIEYADGTTIADALANRKQMT